MTATIVCEWRLACRHTRRCTRAERAYLLDAWWYGTVPHPPLPLRCPSCHRSAAVVGVAVQALDILPGSS